MHIWNAYKYIHNRLAQSRHVRIAACVGSRLWKSTLQPHSTGNAGTHLHPQGQDGVICNTLKPAVFNVLCVRTLCGVPLQPGMLSWQTWSFRTTASKLLILGKVFNCNCWFLIVRMLCQLPKPKPNLSNHQI